MERNNRIKRVLKRVLIIMFVVTLISVCTLFTIINVVQKKGEKAIVNIEELDKDADVIIVLGAGVKANGEPSDILVDRLKTAIEVYKSGVCDKFLLSGDHGEVNYNEVQAMKKYIMDNCDVPEENVFLDHAGFSTYDTMYRARDIFQVKKAIVVTNEYHLPRALYIGEKLGLEVEGVPSDIRNYLFIASYLGREKLAQIKDFIYVNILKPEPEFLGDAIPVSTSDGRVTDDNL